MTGKTGRTAHEHPRADAPAPFATLVELTFQKKKVERWIRFGRKSFEQIIDCRRSLIGFAPESIFAFVRWASNDYGTIASRLDILRAANRTRPCPSFILVARSCCVSTAGRRSSGCWP
ncbi:hypothetical protein GCM10008943_28240 [Paenochrobactrum glaciei]|uniref:Uncharacterized protein n=1 Tax=Paenochrobactrum glaciei TaxID=486407 RepID=A0ABN1GH81_9HYPH